MSLVPMSRANGSAILSRCNEQSCAQINGPKARYICLACVSVFTSCTVNHKKIALLYYVEIYNMKL